jgi:hypothetical protein
VGNRRASLVQRRGRAGAGRPARACAGLKRASDRTDQRHGSAEEGTACRNEEVLVKRPPLPIALAGVTSTVLALSTPTLAEQIDFDDLPANNDSQRLIGDEYAHLGVRFVASDDGATWDGLSAGDPGGFGLDGSRGTRFLGFDGPGYAIAVDFDQPVQGFQLDVARALGAAPFFFDQLQLTGFRNGSRVEQRAVFFGGVGEWRTVGLSEEVDRVVWFGTGLRGHRYGVDALRWEGSEPDVMGVFVDVRPGSERNPIRVDSPGVVPVVVYGDETFAVEDIDLATLGFGPGAAPVAHAHGPHLEDVDGDGWLDLRAHFRVRDAALPPDADLACVAGETVGDLLFEGCDLVTPVGR